MPAIASNTLKMALLNPLRWIGPLLDKELRVTSRRRRNYMLRFAYLALLTGFVAMVWSATVTLEGNAVVQKSRMAMAGKTIVSTVVGFQFVAIQAAAVIMLSTAISDEVYHRTLGLLMTTPVTGWQIVLGKLSSRLLQLLQLLAMSLPLLAMVRVFGGVPVEYILSSFCITLTAVLFAGSLSLFFSINDMRAYVVIIKTVFMLTFFYVGIPVLAAASRGPVVLSNWINGSPFSSMVFSPVITSIFVHLNPPAVMGLSTQMMLTGGGPAGSFAEVRWLVHCGVMLLLVAGVLTLCVRRVRKTAILQARGQLEFKPRHKQRKKSNGKAPVGVIRPDDVVEGPIKKVKGSPVLWRELRAPAIQGVDNTNSRIGFLCAVIAVILTYVSCADKRCLDYEMTQFLYVLVFVAAGGVFTVVRAAMSITTEKESRTWPLLLATPVTPERILLDKAIAVWQRSAPVWLFAICHVVLFVLIGYIHVIAIVHILLLLIWLTVFVTGSGLYFSSLFKRSTSAVVANLALATILWVVLPTVWAAVAAILQKDVLLFVPAAINPAAQIAVIFYAAGGSQNAILSVNELIYQWPGTVLGFADTTWILIGCTLVYTGIGVLLGWLAKRRFRKHIF